MPETGKRSRSASQDRGRYELPDGRTIDGDWWGRFTGQSVALPYDTMTLEEIKALPVGDLADDDAHLYLWTTNRFLWDARAVAEAWGFRYSTLLTWCKTPMGLGFGGAYVLTTEFVLFCRRGSLAPRERHDSTWMQWSRPYENGHIAHSAKPEAFIDLVEKVSPGPYLEIFARRARLGWDYAGDGSLGTVEIPGLRSPEEAAA
jgi:N6-adenosine-specific RNA methylase IME4